MAKELTWEEAEETLKEDIEAMHKHFAQKKVNIEDFNKLSPLEKVGCLVLFNKQEFDKLDVKIHQLIK